MYDAGRQGVHIKYYNRLLCVRAKMPHSSRGGVGGRCNVKQLTSIIIFGEGGGLLELGGGGTVGAPIF